MRPPSTPEHARIAAGLTGAAASPGRLRAGILALMIIAAGLLTSDLLAGRQAGRDLALQREAVATATHRVVTQITERFTHFEQTLRGLRGATAMAGDEATTRRAFRAYSEASDLAEELAGAHGFGLIRRVPESGEGELVARARADGWPGFTVRQVAPHAGERWVIQLVEPIERNAAAVGLDIASEARRRAAAETAMATDRATVTAPITLVQDTVRARRASLVLLPVFAARTAHRTPEERALAAVGWVYLALVIDDVLATLDGVEGLALTLSDVTDGGTPTAFFTSLTPGAAALAAAEECNVLGRRWRVDAAPAASFASHRAEPSPALVFAGGAAVTGVLAIVATILMSSATRRRQSAAELGRLATIVQSSADAIVAQDLAGRIVLWNAAAERMFGYSRDAVLGCSAATLLLPDDRATEDSDVRARAQRDRHVLPFDTQRLQRDGQRVDVSASAALLCDERGAEVGIATVLRDVSERKAHERRLTEMGAALEQRVAERTRELEAARHDLRTALDAMPSMIGYWSRDLVNRFANRVYSDWFEIDASRLPGMTMRELLGDSLFERNRPYVEAALRGEPQSFERKLRHRSGVERHTHAQYLPDIVDGEVRGFYVLVHDVSELAQRTAELDERSRQLEHANRELEAFAYSVSHDLRAPLRAISAFSEVLLEDHADSLGVGRVHLDRILAATARMRQLTEGLLQLSRISRSDLDRTQIDLAALSREVIEELRLGAPARPVEVAIPRSLPAQGDLRLVRVLLWNLLSNAWKFTAKEPSPRIEVGYEGEVYFVRDNGAGFATEYATTLFAPFRRLHSEAEFEGLGIGLATAHRVVARHGGRIWAEGAPGKGAMFRFVLDG